jgi:prophage DNA circulation protein
MTWRSSLQKIKYEGREYVGCSFRGEVFFIESSTESGGRRNVAHEIAFSEDDPYVEDTGKATKTLKVDAYVLGANYHVFRDKLKKALDTKGPGDLVHAYAGKMRASLTGGYTVTETAKNGGIARFSFEFTKTSAFKFPSSKLDAIKTLKSKASTALGVVRESYGEAYNPLGLNSDFLLPVEDGLRELSRKMDQPFSPLLQGAQDLAKFRQRLNAIVENAAALVRSPFDSFDAILDLLKFAFAPPTIPAAFLGLFKSSDPDFSLIPSPPAQTPSRIREAELFRLQCAMIKRVHVIRISEIAADAPFAVSNDAEKVRDSIVEELERELETTNDDEYRALTDLKIAVIQAIPGEDRQLQKRIVVTPKVTTQSLVLAYQFYGDISRELEIVESDPIKHPGFIIGGEPLELVTSG